MDVLRILVEQLSTTYDIQREIGRGGMATVYLAVDRATGAEVAIKALNPELSASISAARFAREIEVASRLDHPNILGCSASGTVEGVHYYVMPFVRGESLRAKIEREGQLAVDETVRIITAAAAALDYAHGQGVIHRDIKPDNLLLDGDRVLVADFGVARVIEAQDGEKLTKTGTSIGTPVYMSPEQCYGRPVGPAADIYALGCVLYEMLVGEPPFSGISITTIMSRHAMEPPPGIGVVRPSVPESVEAAYFAAMQKVPADRPKTAMALAEMMRDAKATLGAVARTTGRMSGMAPQPLATQTVTTPAVIPWYRQPVALIALLLAVAGGSVVLWKVTAGKGPAVSGQEARRLAVLYFDNATGSQELDYLADGLTESVIASLSTIPSLSVVSRGGSELFRESKAPIDSIARVLDVGVLVRGSMAKEGDNLAVSIRLVDGASGADLSRASVSYPAANPLMLRDSVSAQVAELIREQLGSEIRVRDQRDATRNEQAWTLVQRAEATRRRGERALAGGDRAGGFSEFSAVDSLLVAAAALDARWPDPMSLRAALAYRRARITVADPAVAGSWIDSGLVYAEAALQRSSTHADAYEARGNLHYLRAIAGLEPNSQKAEQLIESARADFEKATTLNPGQAGAWATLSHLYYRVGSTLDVNTAARKAYEADAFLSNADVVLQRLFLSSYDLGEFTPKAETYCSQLNRRFGASMYAARCQLLLMTTKARTPEPAKAWLLADSAVMRTAEPQRPYQRLLSDMVVAAVLARAGLADSARRVIDRSQGDPQIDPTRDLVQYAAFASTLLGDTTQAVGYLKRYFAANEARRAAYREDPGWWFRPITGNSEFRKLVGSSP